MPPGWADRPAELDPHRIRRGDVPDDEAVRPAAPTRAQPPPLWGDEDHVRALLGDRVTDVVVQRRTLRVDLFPTPDVWRDQWKTIYGPTVAVYRHIGDDPDEVAALDRDLAALATRYDRGISSTVMHWEYLLLTARKAG